MSAVTSQPDAPAAPEARPARTEPRRRTALSVVPAGPSRRRTPFVVFCFLVLASALVAVLVLNVTMSGGQYTLIELRNEQTALTEQNQALTAQVENNVAPQNLAAKAAKAGMVPAPAPGYINLDRLSVSGNPTAAVKKDAPKVQIPAPAVPGAPSPATTDARVDDGKKGVKSSGTKDPVRPRPVDLYGGTIEAPQQKGR
ncbi:hypothetical protein BKD30_08985 [Tersicoccus phoenicis]|uniref:Cell division protein FtsL n=1 Tax=Tersicoccus phoenicis TaxID=554083 RepID=A0A1R1L9Q0_9MICC|nr:hypothetical protein [Tersicoccus phoenicis]OMH24264.1 hypothetical protein BKD30_08985 [Tersicoccus phoenicis]